MLGEGTLEVVERLELPDVAGALANEHAESGVTVLAVVQRQLQRRDQVHQDGARVSIGAPVARGLDATHDAVVARLFEGFPLGHQGRDGGLVVVQGRRRSRGQVHLAQPS